MEEIVIIDSEFINDRVVAQVWEKRIKAKDWTYKTNTVINIICFGNYTAIPKEVFEFLVEKEAEVKNIQYFKNTGFQIVAQG